MQRISSEQGAGHQQNNLSLQRTPQFAEGELRSTDTAWGFKERKYPACSNLLIYLRFPCIIE